MAIGIHLSNDVRVELGEIKEILFKDLDDAGIEYVVPFDKLNKEGVKETIIHIREIDTEISIENDIISYIKSGNTPFTVVDTLDNNVDVLKHINNIQNKIREKFNSKEYDIKIEKMDTTTMNITLILKSKTERCRIQLVKDNDGEVYINTIRSLS